MGKGIYEDLQLPDNSYLLDEEFLKSEVEKGIFKEEKLPISKLIEFDHHPFNVCTESEDFQELVDSIRDNGVIYPILVRPQGEIYEIVSGHRRVAAAKMAGLNEVPVIIRDMDDYEATVLMVHTNLYRPEISIMEKAKAYRMCNDAEKHQGISTGEYTAEKIGAAASDSRAKVYRYIRLSYLNDYLLQLVSDKKLTVNIGLELSYLNPKHQELLQNVMDEYEMMPNIEQASVLRKHSEEDPLSISKEKIIAMLLGDEKKKSTKSNITFKRKDIEDYFEPNTSPDRMTEIIVMLLEKYKDGVLDEFIDGRED